MSDTEFTYGGADGDVHENPVDVRDVSNGGSVYAVAIDEVFGDGSKSTTHLTQGQARAVRDELDAILGDPDAVDESRDDNDRPDTGRYYVRHESGRLSGPYAEYVVAARKDASNDHHGVITADEVGGVDDPVPDGEGVDESA